MHSRSASLSVALDLACVAPHLQAYEHFDIAGVAAGLRGRDATLAQCRRELRPFLLQLVASAFSSARHCRSVVSKLKLSPIFAAARQAGSTLRLGTLSATTSSNVPPSASITPEESMWRLLLARVVRSGTAPDARAPAIHRLNGCRRCSDQNGLTMPRAVTRPLAIQSNCARRIHCRRGRPDLRRSAGMRHSLLRSSYCAPADGGDSSLQPLSTA